MPADGPRIDPRCRTVQLTSAQPAERAVLLLHGYTNSPHQFLPLAGAYRRGGANVLVPRMPGHGYADRNPWHLSEVNVRRLLEFADAACDRTAELGRRVSVVGISGGATLAAHLAAHRPEVREVALIAPLLNPKVVPHHLLGAASALADKVPDMRLWWDPFKRQALAEPPTAYPGYTLHSIGAFLSIAHRLEGAHRDTPLERLVVITNANDPTVDNGPVRNLVRDLSAGCPDVMRHEFPAELGYGHDLVDVDGENAAVIADIYPVLSRVLGLPG